MEYKALITRFFSMADESIQIIIQDTDTLDTFKERVFNALKVTDYRANVQMRRLFEDTKLTNELSYKELQAARKSAELMYPLEGLPDKLNLGEESAFEFAKTLPSGEVLKIFLHKIDTYEDLSKAIGEIWSIIDSRLAKTNKRELGFMEYVKSVSYETRLKIAMIMDVLYGRALSEDVIQRLKGGKLDETIQKMRDENVTKS